MSQATILVLLSIFAVIYGGNQRICGEQLADTLSLVCNGSFNKRSGLEHKERKSGLSYLYTKRSQTIGVVDECCFREEGCSWATLQSYCAEPAFYDYHEEEINKEISAEQFTAPAVVSDYENIMTTPPSTFSRGRQSAAERFLQVFRSGARSREHVNRRPYWFFLPGLQLGQRATRRPYTVNSFDRQH